MSDTSTSYPGQRLGLPERGVGSIGRVGRRIGALFVDNMAAQIINVAFFPPLYRGPGVEPMPWADANPLITLAIFAVIQVLFIPTIGGSPGHRLFGMRLVREDGAWTGVWRPMVRTLLLIVVIPAVIWDPDQRGLHDKAARTMLIVSRGASRK